MPLTPMRHGKGGGLFWLLAGGAAAGLFTIAAVAWQAASRQRRDGEAALRETARLAAQRALEAVPDEAGGFLLFAGPATSIGSRLQEMHHPNPPYQFGIAFSQSWFQAPGSPGDWIFGPWPGPESEPGNALAEVQRLLAANRRREALEKYQSGPLAVFPARRMPNGGALLTMDGPPAITASGLPLAPLVSRLRIELSEKAGERRTAALQLLVDALAHPSPVTEALVADAISALPDPNTEEASQITAAKQGAAELTRFRLAARNHSDEIRRGAPWIDGQWHLNFGAGGRVTVRSRAQVIEAARRAGMLAESVPGLPQGWGFRPWLDGALLTDRPQEESAVLAAATRAGWTLEAVHDARKNGFATLDAQLLRQRWLIGGAAAALMLAGAGFVLTFLKQRQLNAMMANFVAAVSHELRAPIGSMGLLAERLGDADPAAAGDAAQYARLIRDECRRLSATIENVFAFSRIKRGRAAFDPELSSLTALLRDAAGLVQPRAEQKHVRLQLNLPDAEIECEVDPVALRQAVLNLLDNALKFSPAGGRILVQLRREDARAFISVADDGPGIAVEDRDRIFRPFYRAGSELRRETPGIGIGLAIVKHVAALHGGQAGVVCETGKGSVFFITLPLKH